MDTIDIIVELLEKRKISGAKMSRDLGFSSAVYSQWKSRKQNPSATKIAKIAEYFGVSTDYLLGKEQKEKPSSSDKDFSDSDIKFALFGDNDEITDEMYEDVKRYAQYIAERKKQKG